MEFKKTWPGAVEAASLFYMDLGPPRVDTSQSVVYTIAPEQKLE